MIVSLLFLILCFLVFGPLGFLAGMVIVFIFAALYIALDGFKALLIMLNWLCGELETLLVRFIELLRVSIKNTLLGAWWVLKQMAYMATFTQGRWGLLTLGMLGIVFYQIWPNMLLHLFYHDYFTYIRDH